VCARERERESERERVEVRNTRLSTRFKVSSRKSKGGREYEKKRK